MGFIKFTLKVILAVFILFGAYAAYYYYKIPQPRVDNSDPLIINDIAGLNPVMISEVFKPLSQQNITDAILATQGPISIGGARFSSGGKTAYPDSLHLDMRDYNKILALDIDNKTITVQTGITWRKIQKAIDPENLSIKIMQDYNDFSVGGSLSVNAHGRYKGAGPIINSVKSIKIALASGMVYTATPEKNAELFYGAIGGYGALGVITEATLELVENSPLERSTKQLESNHYLPYFRDNILTDDSIVMHHAKLYPPNFESLLDISWRKTDKALTNKNRLQSDSQPLWWKPLLEDLISGSKTLQRLKSSLFESYQYNKEAIVWRNWESSHGIQAADITSKADSTLGMREYFIPEDEFEIFVLKIRDIFNRNEVDIKNIRVRHSPKDPGSLLAWAKDDVFSFLVTFRQGKSKTAAEKLKIWSSQMNEAAIDSGGSFFIAYQDYEIPALFHRAYRQAGYFFNLKKRADPNNRFNNMFLLQLYPANRAQKEAMEKADNKPSDETKKE